MRDIKDAKRVLPQRVGVLSRLVDRTVNRTALPGRLHASPEAYGLLHRAPVVDLLVGSALFRDSFVHGGADGHVDLPRLESVGVNLVGLTVATAWPDLRGSLSRWHFRSLGLPAHAVRSRMDIAEWLIGRIERWCDESDGQMVIVRTRAELEACLADGGPVGVLLGVQGAHAVEGRLENVVRLRELGVRLLAPAHVMDTDAVGSGTGRRAAGLTGFGRELASELEAQGIIVDLAHMSVPGIEQCLTRLRRPFVLSHTGLTEAASRGSRWTRYSPATRNVPQGLIAEIGAAGGLVGITLATRLLGGSTLSHAVRTIRLALESAGEDQVALGSDMDGALRMLIDVEGLPGLATALRESGMTEGTVAGFMGGNASRFLSASLP